MRLRSPRAAAAAAASTELPGGVVRRVRAALAIVCIAACSGLAAAQEQWSQYRYPDQGFAVQFPGVPKLTSTPLAGPTPATHHLYQAQAAGKAYSISAIAFANGRGPANADLAYLDRLVASYAVGSKTTLRSQNPTTLAGRPALEAVTEDAALDRYHLLDVLAAGARVYLVISEGPKGHETSSDAKRFRDSFTLIGP